MVETTVAISRFWRWFCNHQRQLRNVADDPILLAELERKLSEIGQRFWEIGPFTAASDELYFAIALGKDPHRMPAIEQVINAAPKLDGWRFLVGKPRKSWQRAVRWGEDRLLIDANDWQFVLYRFPDGLHDVVLVKPELRGLSEKEKIDLIGFVVASEIGERLMAETVYSVDSAPSIETSSALLRVDELYSFLAHAAVQKGRLH
jgi:hypothetical protein